MLTDAGSPALLGLKLRLSASRLPPRKRTRLSSSSRTSHARTAPRSATRHPMLCSGTTNGELRPPNSATTRSFTGLYPNTVLCLPQPVTTWISSGRSRICTGMLAPLGVMAAVAEALLGAPATPAATPAPAPAASTLGCLEEVTAVSSMARVPAPAARMSSGASARLRIRRNHQRSTVCAVPADRMRCRSSTPSSSSQRRWPCSCACSSHVVARSHCPISSHTSMRASKVRASGVIPSSCMRAMASPARCHCRRASYDAISELYVCTVRRVPRPSMSWNVASTSAPRPATCSDRSSASYACVVEAPGS
mmetsp:Transcript_41816/g.102993  ORF Transcript_41816/g.102993 Transcript_41816/m.102993 type:complete len:308 (-) Transcript_41816:265-1188(-)